MYANRRKKSETVKKLWVWSVGVGVVAFRENPGAIGHEPQQPGMPGAGVVSHPVLKHVGVIL